jgi:excisionase family DNA binding protein
VAICVRPFSSRRANFTLKTEGNNIMKKPVKTVSIQPLVIGIPSAALMLGVGYRTIWRMIANREIEVTMVGGRKKIRVAEIERYLNENATPVKQAS